MVTHQPRCWLVLHVRSPARLLLGYPGTLILPSSPDYFRPSSTKLQIMRVVLSPKSPTHGTAPTLWPGTTRSERLTPHRPSGFFCIQVNRSMLIFLRSPTSKYHIKKYLWANEIWAMRISSSLFSFSVQLTIWKKKMIYCNALLTGIGALLPSWIESSHGIWRSRVLFRV